MNPGRLPTSAGMQQDRQPGTDSGTELGRNHSGFPHGNNDLSTVASNSRPEWRRDEHGRFMQALELYGSRRTGDEWRLITAFVGSRTIEEVHLHGRQYLQRLIQSLPSSPEATNAGRYLFSAGSQNDPNRQNYQNYQVSRGVGPQKLRVSKRPVPVPTGGTSALSAAALECAQSMSVQQYHNQQLQYQHHAGIAASHRNGRRSKPWTFHEEKAFETVLAGWAGSKSYPWARIAAAIPGKTANDVRSRYEEMVGEIASIESGEVPASENPKLNNVPRGQTAVRPHGLASTLSQRAVPPPPIEVPPRSVGKDGASESSTRSRRGSASGITMLSPTFLDYLAREAESEEKSSLPALQLPFPGLTNLPSPLFSPTLLPTGSPGFFSPGNKKSAARGQQGKKLSSSDDVKMNEIDTGPTPAVNKSETLRRSSTPRIWNEFLAGDFKLDDTPRRKTPRSKKSHDKGSKGNAEKREDIEMPDASAA
ncbi:Myb-like DNA-binding domain [Phytophthora infestans]|uniref:Myb-like DNA-binding domain n=1 Tax=Phytophthora infestans TaxID=4787 RepID=A0A833TK89_PHYIN|nr:Myb-like DNA-binding domain [Phytophthora infestans]KAF4148555.1 Myb-like DNA-binding domain [Phytophthora infestans]